MKKKNFIAEKITKDNMDKLISEMGKMGGRVKSLVSYAKEKFENADEKTKKKIFTGLAGATAVLAVLVGAKRLKKGKKK